MEDSLENFADGKKSPPQHKEYWTLGAEWGVAVSVWEKNVSLQLKHKVKEGEWETKSNFSLSPTVLEKLYIRVPTFFNMIKGGESKK